MAEKRDDFTPTSDQISLDNSTVDCLTTAETVQEGFEELCSQIDPNGIKCVTITDECGTYKAEVDKGGDSRKRLKVEAQLSNENELLCKLDELILAIKTSKESKKQIIDGVGSGIKTRVNKFNALKVVNQNIPSFEDPTILVPNSGFLTDSNGSSNAVVDGSVQPIDFAVRALEDTDLYISGLSFKISDQNAVLNKWGTIAALTTGVQIIYSNQELGERILVDNIKTNFDLIRACQGYPAFASSQGNEAFRASNIIGGSEGYLPVLKIKEIFSLPFGIRLKAGTLDRLIVRINDDITAIDAFDIFYYATEYINN